MDLFSHSPVDIIAVLVKTLKPSERIYLSRTCKRLRASIMNPYVWVFTDFSGNKKLVDEAVVENMAPLLSRCEILSFKTCKRLTDRCFDILKSHCPNIIELNLGIQATNSGKVFRDTLQLNALISSLPRLKTLKLTAGGIKDAKFAAICDSLKGLKELDICANNITASLVPLGEACQELERFDMTGCFKPTSSQLESWATKVSPKLRWVSLMSCERVTDVTIRNLGQRCTAMEHLELTFNEKISDAGADAVCQYFTKLKSLGMQRCTSVTAKGWANLFPNLLDLEYLDISVNPNVTDDCLIQIGTACLNLRHLNLRRTSVTNVGIDALKSLKKLKLLDVTDCSEVTDLSPVLRGCTSLETLALQGCKNLTRSTFSDISNYASKLLKLDCGFTNIDDEAIRDMAKGCKLLRHINAECTALTDKCVDHLVTIIQNRCYDDGDKFAIAICGTAGISEDGLKLLRSAETRLTLKCSRDIGKRCSCHDYANSKT